MCKNGLCKCLYFLVFHPTYTHKFIWTSLTFYYQNKKKEMKRQMTEKYKAQCKQGDYGSTRKEKYTIVYGDKSYNLCLRERCKKLKRDEWHNIVFTWKQITRFYISINMSEQYNFYVEDTFFKNFVQEHTGKGKGKRKRGE